MVSTQRVVLLTGAHEDLGRQIAAAMLRGDARVAAAVPRAFQVDQLRRDHDDQRLFVGHVAPRDAQAAAGLVKGATDVFGPITEFVAAAALIRPPAPDREPAADLEELLDANLHQAVTLARAVLPGMRRRGAGRLCFVAPAWDRAELSSNCTASLAALHGFARSLARRSDPLTVDLVDPDSEPLPG